MNLQHLSQRSAPVRILIFLSILGISALPLVVSVYFLLEKAKIDTSWAILCFALGLIILLPWWNKYIHQQPHHFQHYGLEISRQNGIELLRGLAIGLISIQALFIVQGLLGWLQWQQPNSSTSRFILEAIPTALGTAFAEELLFRGWIYDELERDYKPNIVIWASSLIFAVSHFLKPIPEIIRTFPQFFGLLLLALTLAWAKQNHRRRLGLSIGIHAGLIWGWYVINVGKLIKYSGTVPQWVTGVNDNPLAGIIGIIFLFLLALWSRFAHLKSLKSS
jgi:uncharacterized protein